VEAIAFRPNSLDRIMLGTILSGHPMGIIIGPKSYHISDVCGLSQTSEGSLFDETIDRGLRQNQSISVSNAKRYDIHSHLTLPDFFCQGETNCSPAALLAAYKTPVI
jgi:hypothetical protein